MKIGLAVCNIENNKIAKNKYKIIKTIKKAKKQAVDLLLFSESALQGFDSLSWKYERDKTIALSVESRTVQEIAKACRKNYVAIGLGYIELCENDLYSSYIIIGKDGNTLYNYKRMSAGWKERGTDSHYKEGTTVGMFSFMNKKFRVGLCGDFWEDAILEQHKICDGAYVCWPVFTDYKRKEWVTSAEAEYEAQSKRIGLDVFQINHISKHSSKALGGAYYYKNGKIQQKLPLAKEGILCITVGNL
ncbi:MAG: nitrilase-related carbon-nitrogen hydrolase [Treponema sp.]